MFENLRMSIIRFLLRRLRHEPGKEVVRGNIRYIVDANGSWRKLTRRG